MQTRGSIFAYSELVSIFTRLLFIVQPSVKSQLKKYISLRVQCSPWLEILLPGQLKKKQKKNKVGNYLHVNQSNNSGGHTTPERHLSQNMVQ